MPGCCTARDNAHHHIRTSGMLILNIPIAPSMLSTTLPLESKTSYTRRARTNLLGKVANASHLQGRSRSQMHRRRLRISLICLIPTCFKNHRRIGTDIRPHLHGGVVTMDGTTNGHLTPIFAVRVTRPSRCRVCDPEKILIIVNVPGEITNSNAEHRQ